MMTHRRVALTSSFKYPLRWDPVSKSSIIFQRYAQRNIFEILLSQTEIRLYLPFSDWFGTKWTSVWFQINRKMVNTIWFWFDLLRFRKDSFVFKLVDSNNNVLTNFHWNLSKDSLLRFYPAEMCHFSGIAKASRNVSCVRHCYDWGRREKFLCKRRQNPKQVFGSF